MKNRLKTPHKKNGGILALKIIGAFCAVGTAVVCIGFPLGMTSVDFSKDGPSAWIVVLFYPVMCAVCLTAAHFKEKKLYSRKPKNRADKEDADEDWER